MKLISFIGESEELLRKRLKTQCLIVVRIEGCTSHQKHYACVELPARYDTKLINRSNTDKTSIDL